VRIAERASISDLGDTYIITHRKIFPDKHQTTSVYGTRHFKCSVVLVQVQPIVRSVRESLVSNLVKCHITEYIATVSSTVLNSHDPPNF